MAKYRVGISFSKDFIGNDPLGHIGVKLPVYLRFLGFCRKEGWIVYVLTRKTYRGNGVFNGAWLFDEGKFEKVDEPINIDLVYDRSAGVKFPPEGDDSTIWVDRLDFKILCWKFLSDQKKKPWDLISRKNTNTILPRNLLIPRVELPISLQGCTI